MNENFLYLWSLNFSILKYYKNNKILYERFNINVLKSVPEWNVPHIDPW